MRKKKLSRVSNETGAEVEEQEYSSTDLITYNKIGEIYKLTKRLNKVRQAKGLGFMNHAQKDCHVDNNDKLQCHNLDK